MSSSSEASPLLKQDFLKEEIIVLSPGPLDVVSDHLLLLNKGKPSEQLPAAVQSVHLSKTYGPASAHNVDCFYLRQTRVRWALYLLSRMAFILFF